MSFPAFTFIYGIISFYLSGSRKSYWNVHIYLPPIIKKLLFPCNGADETVSIADIFLRMFGYATIVLCLLCLLGLTDANKVDVCGIICFLLIAFVGSLCDICIVLLSGTVKHKFFVFLFGVLCLFGICIMTYTLIGVITNNISILEFAAQFFS